MRVAPVHVRRHGVADQADFSRLLNHTYVVVVEVLIVIYFKVAPREHHIILNELWIELLVHVPADKRLISRQEEVSLVKLEGDRLAKGRL